MSPAQCLGSLLTFPHSNNNNQQHCSSMAWSGAELVVATVVRLVVE